MVTTPAIPEQPMTLVQGRVNRLWIRELSTHHLIIAESGSGKTGLIVKCILPLCTYDRMVFIDVKNDTDPMLSEVGRPIGPGDVAQVLAEPSDGPRKSWYRLVVDPVNKRDQARTAVNELLGLALTVGDMVIVTDEARTITGTGDGALGLVTPYENVLKRGRSHGVSVVSAIADTGNMQPAALRTQRTFTWVGAVNGNDGIKATLGILGLPTMQKVGNGPNPYWAVVRDLKQGEWLYQDNKGSAGIRNCMARVTSWVPEWDKLAN
jgi:hypothetical protein